jgi:YD repeat-containing protein
MVRETLPDGTGNDYAYDALGRAVSKADGNGNVVANAYDALGRVTGRTVSAGP